jgi:hypothetical protein
VYNARTRIRYHRIALIGQGKEFASVKPSDSII